MASGNTSSKDEPKDPDDFCVEEPEEAKYNFSDEKGLWQPKPEDILSLFKKLAGGGPLPLKWQCPGRRAPKSKEEVNEESTSGWTILEKHEEKEEKPAAPEASAFDFDEFPSEANTKLTPIRAPGGTGRTPRTKKLARMDNIIDSLRRQHRQSMAEREARRAKGSPSSGTPKSRLFGMKRSSAANPVPAVSQTAAAFPVPAVVTTTSALASNFTEIVATPSNFSDNTISESITATVPLTFTTTTTTSAFETPEKPVISIPSVTHSERSLQPTSYIDSAPVIVSATLRTSAVSPVLGAPLPFIPQVPNTSSEVTNVVNVNQSSISLAQDVPVSYPLPTAISSSSITSSVKTQQKSQTEPHPTCVHSSTEKNQSTILSTATLSSEPLTTSVASFKEISSAYSSVAAPAAATCTKTVQQATILAKSTAEGSESMAGPPIMSPTIKPTSAVVTMTSAPVFTTLVESTATPEPSVSPPSLPPPFSVPIPTTTPNTISSPITTSASLTDDPALVTTVGQTLELHLSEPNQSLSTSAQVTVVAAASKPEIPETEVKAGTAEASLPEITPKDNVESEIKCLSLAEKS
ncbi:hypothetical protein RRG08_045950 [Elysia crispata]|uniref:Uncharacterized protein n=1 Tax=Elysia crispata TaxID=231223 RepID=A0AAE1E395_9GAST|nr:hypothetical protein RRG08_045950 [Elysia crispata]